MVQGTSDLLGDVVPVIDLAPLRDGTLESKTALAAQVDEAARTIGFFAIKNAPIDAGVVDTCWDACKNFFDRPTEVKATAPMTDDYPYGYMGFKVEQLSAALGDERPPDLKESFNLGPSDPRADAPPRRWPEGETEFQKGLESYYEEMNGLANKLLSLCAIGLGLEENWFVDKTDHHCSALRALNYPAANRAPEKDQYRASPHTDYGSLTILLSGGPGLQVRNRAGQWTNITAAPGMFVVNLGDLMPYWTNERWVSTLHRVVYIDEDYGNRRQSIAFFHNMNKDARIECIPTCHGPGNPPKYPPITAGEHLLRKHAATMASATSKGKL